MTLKQYAVADMSPGVDSPAVNSDGVDQRRRVLVVEDDEDSLTTLIELLASVGFEVEGAREGTTALAIASAFRPTACLVDIDLPGIDGYEVARRLRALLGGDSDLVALTGYGRDGDRQRCFAAGFDAHFVKPVDLDAVIARVMR